MVKYIFQCRTSIGGIPWRYEMSFASDKGAIEFAEAQIQNLLTWNCFMGLDIWRAPGGIEDRVAYVTGKLVADTRVIPG